MTTESIHFRIAGICAIATAFCAVAGTAVGVSYGLGGQNLPVATYDQLAFLAEMRVPFLIREWLFLLLAIFGVGEGLGLYFLLRRSPLAIWALIAWMIGLTIGIVEDAAVIAVINQAASIDPGASDAVRDCVLVTTATAVESIKVQQFVSLLLCATVGYCVFSIVGYRSRKLPLWLYIVGIVGGVTTGCFGFCNAVPGLDHLVAPLENGFALLIVWDAAIGILLLSSARDATMSGSPPT